MEAATRLAEFGEGSWNDQLYAHVLRTAGGSPSTVLLLLFVGGFLAGMCGFLALAFSLALTRNYVVSLPRFIPGIHGCVFGSSTKGTKCSARVGRPRSLSTILQEGLLLRQGSGFLAYKT